MSLAYDPVYFLGNSLSSVHSKETTVNVTHAFGKEKHVIEFPDPKAYYRGRFSNGPNFFDHLKDLMPELPLCEENNFAYPGAGAISNTANYEASSKIKEFLNNLNWVESFLLATIITTAHPGFDKQFQSVIDKEKTRIAQNQQGTPLVIVWYGGHNDMISLPSIAEYDDFWEKLPSITENDVKNLQQKLLEVSHIAGKKLCQHLISLNDIGIHNIAYLDGLPVHLTPFFIDLKKRYKDIHGFVTFIDSMSTTYNGIVHKYLYKLEYMFDSQKKFINITRVKNSENIVFLQSDLESSAFLNSDAEREGKKFDLWQATEEDVKKMEMFYDPVHLTSSGALKLAKFAAEELRKDPNIQRYLIRYGVPSHSAHNCGTEPQAVIAARAEYKRFLQRLAQHIRNRGPDIIVDHRQRIKSNYDKVSYDPVEWSEYNSRLLGCIVCIEGFSADELDLSVKRKNKNMLVTWEKGIRRSVLCSGDDRGVEIKGFNRSSSAPFILIHKAYNTWRGAKFLTTINGPNGYEYPWGMDFLSLSEQV